MQSLSSDRNGAGIRVAYSRSMTLAPRALMSTSRLSADANAPNTSSND